MLVLLADLYFVAPYVLAAISFFVACWSIEKMGQVEEKTQKLIDIILYKNKESACYHLNTSQEVNKAKEVLKTFVYAVSDDESPKGLKEDKDSASIILSYISELEKELKSGGKVI